MDEPCVKPMPHSVVGAMLHLGGGALRRPSHSPTALAICHLISFFSKITPPFDGSRIGGLVPWVRLFSHAKPMAATKLSIKYPSQEARPSRGGAMAEWTGMQNARTGGLVSWGHFLLTKGILRPNK